MSRPKGGYKLADGTKVPGVTTVIGKLKDAGPLMYWAWQQGVEGKDFRETRDAAASAGTVVHAFWPVGCRPASGRLERGQRVGWAHGHTGQPATGR